MTANWLGQLGLNNYFLHFLARHVPHPLRHEFGHDSHESREFLLLYHPWRRTCENWLGLGWPLLFFQLLVDRGHQRLHILELFQVHLLKTGEHLSYCLAVHLGLNSLLLPCLAFLVPFCSVEIGERSFDIDFDRVCIGFDTILFVSNKTEGYVELIPRKMFARSICTHHPELFQSFYRKPRPFEEGDGVLTSDCSIL